MSNDASTKEDDKNEGPHIINLMAQDVKYGEVFVSNQKDVEVYMIGLQNKTNSIERVK